MMWELYGSVQHHEKMLQIKAQSFICTEIIFIFIFKMKLLKDLQQHKPSKTDNSSRVWS